MKLLEPFGTENTEYYGATASGFRLCEFLCALCVKFFFLS
jgi:hypothetical protein